MDEKKSKLIIKRPSWRNIVFTILIVLLLAPPTRKPIQVALNRLKLSLFTPSVIDNGQQEKLPPFNYQVVTLGGSHEAIPIGSGDITFLSYWATWCPPCIAELPSIEKLYVDYGDKVNFVLVSQEDPIIIQQFLKKKSLSIPAVTSTMPTPETLYTSSIPTNYIIDQSGHILVKELGASDWNSDDVRQLLDSLLAN